MKKGKEKKNKTLQNTLRESFFLAEEERHAHLKHTLKTRYYCEKKATTTMKGEFEVPTNFASLLEKDDEFLEKKVKRITEEEKIRIASSAREISSWTSPTNPSNACASN